MDVDRVVCSHICTSMSLANSSSVSLNSREILTCSRYHCSIAKDLSIQIRGDVHPQDGQRRSRAPIARDFKAVESRSCPQVQSSFTVLLLDQVMNIMQIYRATTTKLFDTDNWVLCGAWSIQIRHPWPWNSSGIITYPRFRLALFRLLPSRITLPSLHSRLIILKALFITI